MSSLGQHLQEWPVEPTYLLVSLRRYRVPIVLAAPAFLSSWTLMLLGISKPGVKWLVWLNSLPLFRLLGSTLPSLQEGLQLETAS